MSLEESADKVRHEWLATGCPQPPRARPPPCSLCLPDEEGGSPAGQKRTQWIHFREDNTEPQSLQGPAGRPRQSGHEKPVSSFGVGRHMGAAGTGRKGQGRRWTPSPPSFPASCPCWWASAKSRGPERASIRVLVSSPRESTAIQMPGSSPFATVDPRGMARARRRTRRDREQDRAGAAITSMGGSWGREP